MAKTPDFKTEEEEAKFWDTHDSTNFLDDTEEVKEPIFVLPKAKKKQTTKRLPSTKIKR